MNDWGMVMIAEEHRNDLLREAQQERLARLALQGRGSRDGLCCRALLGLGRRLAALGARLQERYGGAAERPALGSAPSRPA